MRNGIALLALVLALVALALHLVGGGSSRESNAPAAAAADLGPLEARLGALEGEIERLAATVEALRVVPAGVAREPASASSPELDELLRRVAELESRPAASPEAGADAPTGAEAAELLRRRASGVDLQGAIDRGNDSRATEAERLEALRALRGRRDSDGLDARRYVLESMLELARTSQDGDARADVWRQLSGLDDPRLRQPLLDTLAYDLHAEAREEAAETLADFLPDVAVEAALRAAVEHDADAGVRRQASESLAGGR